MNADAIEVLRSHPRLAELSESQLAAIAGRASEERFAPGEALVRAGDDADAVLLILDGEVEVRSGAGLELGRLGAGALIGLVAIVDRGPRSANVTAGGEVRAARLPIDAYASLAADDEDLRIAFQLAAGAQLASDFRRIARRARDLLSTNAELSRRVGVRDYDVVVIGGGPLGISYATWVKRARPETRIAVVERRAAPGYKIGESTLAPTIRNLVSVGLPMPVQRRLFYTKLELSYWWTDTRTDQLTTHLSPGEFDETFQIERRVLETALLEVARRIGIHVYQDTTVKVRESDLESHPKELHCEAGDGQALVLRANIVCDASGPSSVVPRALGLYRKPELNFNAYFGYFRQTSMPPDRYWDVAATRHLCFPDGWMWFIDITSFEKTPDDRLSALVNHLLDQPEGPDESYPTRNELVEKFGCTTEPIVSIGIVPRVDRDSSLDLPVEDRLGHFVDKYPAIRRIMNHYELVPPPYEGHRNFTAFMKMSHDCERVTGDGWLAVGDAAFFVNPLFSPGLSYGSGTAYMAARDTVDALSRHDFSQAAFSRYEQYARDVFRGVFRENEMYYRSFVHPDSYERAWLFKFAHSGMASLTAAMEAGPPQGPGYQASDPYFGGILHPRQVEIEEKVVEAMRANEHAGAPAEDTAAAVKAIVDPAIDDVRANPITAIAHFSTFFVHYSDDLRRTEDAERQNPRLATWRCQTCREWNLTAISSCHVCATPRPASVVVKPPQFGPPGAHGPAPSGPGPQH